MLTVFTEAARRYGLVKWLCFLILEALKTALIQNVGKIDCLHYFDFFRNELMR